MIERFILSENAYFYRKNKNISRRALDSIFIEVSRAKTGRFDLRVVKQVERINNIEIIYSLCVFKFKEKPSFLDAGSEEEVKYAYLLIVEYSNFIIINKKNISGLDKLMKDFILGLDYLTISRLFVSDTTFFEKFSMSNMDISDNVIRRRNIEASNLKHSFAPFGASKYILSSMRISEQSGSKISLTFNTSRINKLGKKVGITEFLTWVIEVVNRVEIFTNTVCYLDSFSTPLSFEDYIENLEPQSLLLNFLSLINDLENGYLINVYYEYGDRRRTIDLVSIFNRLDKLCVIERVEDGDAVRFKVNNLLDKNLQLKINKSSITLNSRKLKNILLEYNDSTVNLLTWLNRSQDFIITFNEIEVVYWAKKLFRDSQLLGNLEFFLGVFVPYSELSLITSEKGQFNQQSLMFSDDSLFHFIENKLANNADYILCDDLGDEWADYISFEMNKSIQFYHAKSGTEGLSASNFHEVVSQAQKNIGNVFASEDQLSRKREKWNAKYSSTNIDRLRKGSNVEESVESYRNTLLLPNTRKEIYLVVNFISKLRLEQEVINLKAGERVAPQIIQILWLISSLVLSCKEANTDIYIVCLP
ncbi:MAG: hypothetical protein WCR27_03635 [Eubacteriales bacterium]